MIALLLVSCSGLDPDPPNIPSSGEFLIGDGEEYVNFKKGSFWVYDNSIDGRLDTIIVKEYSHTLSGVYNPDKPLRFTKDKFDIVWGTRFGATHIRCSPECGPETLATSYFRFWAWDYDGDGNTIFFYPLTDLTPAGCLNHFIPGPMVYDSLDINNETFYEVAEFQGGIDGLWGAQYECSYYWARNVGLISIKMFDTLSHEYKGSWDLLEYHLK